MFRQLIPILFMSIRGVEVTKSFCYYAKHYQVITLKDIGSEVSFDGSSVVLDTACDLLDVRHVVDGRFILRPRSYPESVLVKCTLIFTESEYEKLITKAEYMFLILNLKTDHLSESLCSHVYHVNKKDSPNFKNSEDETFILFSYFLKKDINLFHGFNGFMEVLGMLKSISVRDYESTMLHPSHFCNFKFLNSANQAKGIIVELHSKLSSFDDLIVRDIYSLFLSVIERSQPRSESDCIQAINLLFDIHNLISSLELIENEECTFELPLNQYSLNFYKTLCFSLTDLQDSSKYLVNVYRKVEDKTVDVVHEVHRIENIIYILILEEYNHELVISLKNEETKEVILLHEQTD